MLRPTDNGLKPTWFSFKPNLTLLRPICNFVETNFLVSTDFFLLKQRSLWLQQLRMWLKLKLQFVEKIDTQARIQKCQNTGWSLRLSILRIHIFCYNFKHIFYNFRLTGPCLILLYCTYMVNAQDWIYTKSMPTLIFNGIFLVWRS